MDFIMENIMEININEMSQTNECRMENITEQKFLELAEDFKGIVSEKDDEIKKINKELNDFKLMIYKLLGIVSFVEDIILQLDIGHYQQTIEHNLAYITEQIKLLLTF